MSCSKQYIFTLEFPYNYAELYGMKQSENARYIIGILTAMPTFKLNKYRIYRFINDADILHQYHIVPSRLNMF